ncbi:hypothetical protein SY83_14855 [Paenibacillus swuensis]|uniref:DUF1540 domain-containing protein n=1 Tax=Paenibacillus swuensis TaxID=1178515 RepID=A0A172TK38_9BACL|nr:DUF1540 domain-containing protein [Paenibacillus swuensis]ANE47336.1 hypothetical protein SY83_14855 [Paenibacillus swuensis]
MEKPVVKCSVSNCNFWGQGNNCQADAIMIDIDAHSRMNYNEEFAGESFDSDHKDEVKTSSATCCHTFRPKDE